MHFLASLTIIKMTHGIFVQRVGPITGSMPPISLVWHWSPRLWAEAAHNTNSPSAPHTGILRCGKLHEVGRFGVFRKHCIRVSKLAHTCVHPQTAQVAHLLKMCESNY